MQVYFNYTSLQTCTAPACHFRAEAGMDADNQGPHLLRIGARRKRAAVTDIVISDEPMRKREWVSRTKRALALPQSRLAAGLRVPFEEPRADAFLDPQHVPGLPAYGLPLAEVIPIQVQAVFDHGGEDDFDYPYLDVDGEAYDGQPDMYLPQELDINLGAPIQAVHDHPVAVHAEPQEYTAADLILQGGWSVRETVRPAPKRVLEVASKYTWACF